MITQVFKLVKAASRLEFSLVPGVVLDLFNSHALYWINDKKASDKVLCLIRDIFPYRLIEIIFSFFDHFKELKFVFVPERRSATQKTENCYS